MTNKENKTLIWDLPLRIFHWLLALLIGYAWFSVEVLNDLDQHFVTGYAILALLLFRLVWGFVGPYHARFGSFIKGPAATWAYMKDQSSHTHGGHNPLGAWSAVLLLVLVAAQAISGLFSDDEYYYFGPLTGYVSGKTVGTMTNFHYLNFNFILAAVGLHILAILFYALVKKQHLVPAMITGYKADPHNKLQGIQNSKIGLALLLIVIAGAIVYGISSLGS